MSHTQNPLIAQPGDVIYHRDPDGSVILGLVTVAGTLTRTDEQPLAQMIYLSAAARSHDASGVNGNVYDWQPQYDLMFVSTFGYPPPDSAIWRPESPEERAECPQCRSTTGKPVEWDHGMDPDTGYHDAGEGCTECTRGDK